LHKRKLNTERLLEREKDRVKDKDTNKENYYLSNNHYNITEKNMYPSNPDIVTFRNSNESEHIIPHSYQNTYDFASSSSKTTLNTQDILLSNPQSHKKTLTYTHDLDKELSSAESEERVLTEQNDADAKYLEGKRILNFYNRKAKRENDWKNQASYALEMANQKERMKAFNKMNTQQRYCKFNTNHKNIARILSRVNEDTHRKHSREAKSCMIRFQIKGDHNTPTLVPMPDFDSSSQSSSKNSFIHQETNPQQVKLKRNLFTPAKFDKPFNLHNSQRIFKLNNDRLQLIKQSNLPQYCKQLKLGL
jgi:hypothetical protein